jgi:enamine deaminase RidA (YjgF/YER057c/UK114 family)
MTQDFDKKLIELGIALPEAAAPVANYVHAVQVGKLLYVSGQIPMRSGQLAISGKAGIDVDEARAAEAARICAINVLAQVKTALGTLNKVKRVVRLGVFVASADGFTRQPQVANAASDLMVAVFGDQGRHARAAVGVNVLPLDATVEVEAVFEVK